MKRFSNILVVADEESGSDAVFARARWLAEANGAKLTLIDVIDTSAGELARLFSALSGARAREVEGDVLAYHRERLDTLADTLRDDGLSVETKVLQGVAFIETIRHVLKHENDLVLKGAHVTPGLSILRGPDLHLLRKCPCPVWILTNTTKPTSRRIMAAVDPDPEDAVRDKLNRTVMELATSLSRQDEAKLDVVNAWHLQEESTLRSTRIKMPKDEIEAILKKAELDSSNRLQALVADFEAYEDIMRVVHMKGVPADVIAEHAETEQIDTLVMGTVGRTGLAGFFIGNTAETILNRVGCSVLTVKPEGFVSPVTLDGAHAS